MVTREPAQTFEAWFQSADLPDELAPGVALIRAAMPLAAPPVDLSHLIVLCGRNPERAGTVEYRALSKIWRAYNSAMAALRPRSKPRRGKPPTKHSPLPDCFIVGAAAYTT
jgi:hypothetical protein